MTEAHQALAFLAPLAIALAAALILSLALLFAVREGRLGSPTARSVAVAIILAAALLAGLASRTLVG